MSVKADVRQSYKQLGGFNGITRQTPASRVFILRPGYILQWAHLRMLLNYRCDALFRSQRRLSEWVETVGAASRNSRLLPIELYSRVRKNKVWGVWGPARAEYPYYHNSISGANSLMGVYNRGYNWNYRI